MLKLRKGKPPFVPVSLGGGAFIRVRAATQVDIDACHTAARNALAGLINGSEAGAVLGEILGDDFNVDALNDNTRLATALSRLSEIYLVMECQDGWVGIGDDDGTPIEAPDHATLALLLNDGLCNRKIMAVVSERLHQEQEEKNGSAASPNGGAGTPDGAQPADATATLAPSADLSKASSENGAAARKSKTRR